MSLISLVHAIHLNQWAMTHDARIKLGGLLRRLIHASIPLPLIRNIRFLSDESTGLTGWDGFLDCDSDVPWIPNGSSVYELGTGTEARDKIRKDFENRRDKALPSGLVRNETTYVAVTIRNLDDLAELENELKQNSPWRDVKVFDATTIQEWVGQYPSVTTWLQEQGVGPSPNTHTLGYDWQVWSERTQPIMSPKLVLADRDKLALGLINALKNPGGIINIQADSPDEAVAFVFAVLETEDPEFQQYLIARSIVIRNSADADYLRNCPPQLVILLPPATENAQILARCGHIIINALGNSTLAQRVDFALNRPYKSNFSKALMEMGMTKEKAEIESRACGASPSVWRVWNLLQSTDFRPDIEWAKPQNADLSVSAILIGAWSEQFEGDKEIIYEISGLDYSSFRDRIHQFLYMDNPLLIKIGGDVWIVSAPSAFFALMINHITFSQLQKFSNVVLKVFQELDPTIDLSPEERPYAAIKTKKMQHSTWLRDGLAETLLRIVVIGERLERGDVIPGNQSCQSFVDHLIRSLPGLQEDWRLLASLRHQLPILAEASPFPFIEALESLLQGQLERILPIFAEGEISFGGHSFLPDFLWALETLAWEPSLLTRTGLILANLAKIDPGGRLGNRPINSLREIFLAWHPGTSASLEERLQVLDLIIERFPEVGWKLLMALMPKGYDSSSPTHSPKWKDFGRSQRKPLTVDDTMEVYQKYIDRALLLAGYEPNRWEELIGIYSRISESHQQGIENGLIKLSNTGLSQDACKSIWNKIRDYICRHREYPDAYWSLPGDRLDHLEKISELFTPSDSIDYISWLFNEYFPNIPFPRKPLDKLNEEISRLRCEAINNIWQEGGINLLLTLINNVAFPNLVAKSFLDLFQDANKVLDIFEKTNQGSPNMQLFAKCLSGLAYKEFGDHWTDSVLLLASKLDWPSEAIVNAIEQYPDSIKTFELVSSLGAEIERLYWKIRHSWIHAEDSAAFLVAVNKLKGASRALEVIEQIHDKLSELNSKEVLRIIDQALEELNEGKLSNLSDIGFQLRELFDWLRKQPNIDKIDIARREYQSLPLHAGHRQQKKLALHELLATDPNFFVDVLCDLYKAASNEADIEPISEESRSRAHYAWELLQSWHLPPGIEENGQVDALKLRDWVENARKLASERDRNAVADQHIGKVLYYFPSDPADLAWPHNELRKLLEDLHCKEIETGIEIEQFNARGTVSKAFLEGGSQERELSKKWQIWAETLGLAWPRTRAMLERIASSWESSARQEDERAEKDRHRFGK